MIKIVCKILQSAFVIITISQTSNAQKNIANKILVLAENGGHHILFTQAAKPWLNDLAKEKDVIIDYIENTTLIDEEFLKQYKLFIQLDYPPYAWGDKAMQAFQKYIEEGRGGWVGLHHATLLGTFDGYPMWNWFSMFMGDIEFKNYIPTFCEAKVNIEKTNHPCMKNVAPSFLINKEEWYTYNKTPRPNVQVLASVDETSYSPTSTIKMGDHPVVWTNKKFSARNIYIFMGHSPELFQNKNYTTLLRNSILWAASY